MALDAAIPAQSGLLTVAAMYPQWALAKLTSL
jgi:hypothetical protein